MSFNYLEFWSCEDKQKTQQQNKKFKDSVKGEVIRKPLLTNKVLICESKDNTFNNNRQRPKDLKNFFIKSEFKILRELKA